MPQNSSLLYVSHRPPSSASFVSLLAALCHSLSLHLNSVCLWNETSFPLGSLFYPAPPLFSVSRTQMRTLKCRLRYTGLTSWPCSVHHNPTTRCTELLKKICHLSFFAICPLRLFLLLLLLTRWLSLHTQTVHSLLTNSSLEFKAVASSKYTIESHFSRASICIQSTIHISSLNGASNSLFSSSVKFLTLGWCGLCHRAFFTAVAFKTKLPFSLNKQKSTLKPHFLSTLFVLQYSFIRRVKGENVFIKHSNLMLEVGKKISHDGSVHGGAFFFLRRVLTDSRYVWPTKGLWHC